MHLHKPRNILACKYLVAPLAGATAVVAALACGGCAAGEPTTAVTQQQAQEVRAEGLLLFGAPQRSKLVPGGIADVSYAAELLLPQELAPSNPDWPRLVGTRKPVGHVMRELAEAVQTIEDEGYEIGFALYDVNTGYGVTYNENRTFYSASSIKGPYVVSVARYELQGSVTSEASTISAILQYSDNDAYARLRAAYGDEPMAQLVADSGAEGLPGTGATEEISAAAQILSGAGIADNNYEFYTPAQLLALWRSSYDYLASDEAGAAWLAEQFEQPETSAIRVTAGSLGTTWSKAGWYPEDSAGYGTTVDAGVIRTDEGDVILAVMTNKPEDFTTMETVVSPLLTLRAALVS